MTPRAVIGVGVALAATILPAPLAAQETDPVSEWDRLEPEFRETAAGPVHVIERERFNLYTGCAAVGLVVHAFYDDPDGSLGGIDHALKNKTETAVRSRLRAARIYDPEEVFGITRGNGDPEASDYLSVTVDRVDPDRLAAAELEGPYSLRLGFNKSGIQDPRSGIAQRINTWELSLIGSFEDFREMLDRFMDSYLRVNECGP